MTTHAEKLVSHPAVYVFLEFSMPEQLLSINIIVQDVYLNSRVYRAVSVQNKQTGTVVASTQSIQVFLLKIYRQIANSTGHPQSHTVTHTHTHARTHTHTHTQTHTRPDTDE